jgi:hypothetical protein
VVDGHQDSEPAVCIREDGPCPPPPSS